MTRECGTPPDRTVPRMDTGDPAQRVVVEDVQQRLLGSGRAKDATFNEWGHSHPATGATGPSDGARRGSGTRTMSARTSPWRPRMRLETHWRQCAVQLDIRRYVCASTSSHWRHGDDLTPLCWTASSATSCATPSLTSCARWYTSQTARSLHGDEERVGHRVCGDVAQVEAEHQYEVGELHREVRKRWCSKPPEG